MSNDHVKPSTCPKCGSNDKRVYRKPCDDGTMDHPTRNADPWHGWRPLAEPQLGICNFNDIHLRHPHLRESWCLFWRLVEHATAPAEPVQPEYSPCSRYPYAESAPAPATAPPITGAMIVELMDEHETNYVQKMERRWEWSCACGENQWFHEREFAVMMTRSHWADEIMKLLRVTSAPSAAVKEEK